ncbi:MAG: hypothetical protein JST47_13015 [Bacteroidetes bacterium]|nr:hypothetical protein [Bacteroidota bacterium]MBS1974577.1 hypothetical protein [Bacteroidota bacterium]
MKQTALASVPFYTAVPTGPGFDRTNAISRKNVFSSPKLILADQSIELAVNCIKSHDLKAYDNHSGMKSWRLFGHHRMPVT